MEMGDLFHWTQAIGRGAFKASHYPNSQHRLPGFHLPGRYQRDLRQRSRKGRVQQSHTINEHPRFQIGAGLTPPHALSWGWVNSAHG